MHILSVWLSLSACRWPPHILCPTNHTLSLIDPDDRKTVVEAMVRVLYTATAKREALLVKVRIAFGYA